MGRHRASEPDDETTFIPRFVPPDDPGAPAAQDLSPPAAGDADSTGVIPAYPAPPPVYGPPPDDATGTIPAYTPWNDGSGGRVAARLPDDTGAIPAYTPVGGGQPGRSSWCAGRPRRGAAGGVVGSRRRRAA